MNNLWSSCDFLHFGHQIFYDPPPSPYFSFKKIMNHQYIWDPPPILKKMIAPYIEQQISRGRKFRLLGMGGALAKNLWSDNIGKINHFFNLVSPLAFFLLLLLVSPLTQ